jgi:flagellar basal body P-ring formation protein FlgA
MKPTNFGHPICKHFGRYIIGLLALVLLPATACNIFASDLTRIRILEKVQVDDEKILLSDIAKIEGSDSLLIQKLSAIMVGRAPLPGNSRILDGSKIKTCLKQNGIDLAELILNIPPSIDVSRSFIEVSQEQIKGLVSEHISKNLLSGNSNASIKRIQVSESLRLPGGRITYEVKAPRNRQMVGQIPFAVRFDVNGKLYKRVWATVTIEVLAEVVITKKPLGRHKPITEDDIMVLKMDLAKVPSDVITDPETVLGKRTRRAIGSNTVLRANLVEFPPLVRRGDVVVIVAETQGIKITALGQVKKKGALGDRIPVINLESKKVLYARVIDSNTVKIDF